MKNDGLESTEGEKALVTIMTHLAWGSAISQLSGLCHEKLKLSLMSLLKVRSTIPSFLDIHSF